MCFGSSDELESTGRADRLHEAMPLVFGLPNGEVSKDEGPADHEIAVAEDLLLPHDALAVKTEGHNSRSRRPSEPTRETLRASGGTSERVCGSKEGRHRSWTVV